jgi:hypothetical protein
MFVGVVSARPKIAKTTDIYNASFSSAAPTKGSNIHGLRLLRSCLAARILYHDSGLRLCNTFHFHDGRSCSRRFDWNQSAGVRGIKREGTRK